jgi:hypothetical protein
MSELKSEKMINHLKHKWQGRKCPMCNGGTWNVSDRVYELREYHGGKLVVGGSPIVPVVPVTCDNCGNTVLVNAIVSEAVEKEGSNG